MSCGYCGKDGHDARNCPANKSLRCTYCGGTDHNYEACMKHAGGGKLPGAVRVGSSRLGRFWGRR